tara:strand:- start:532 stop:1626 length:1095 start_codon:yes stop_codon:yes gene_type:complete
LEKIIQIEPWIDNSELKQLSRLIESTYVTENLLTKEFEEKTANLTKSPFAISVCNGTAGLFCALKALNLSPGDQVIVPNITFIASATSVILAGLDVVLVDVDPNTACININSLKKAINKKTKVIMPVHLYGISCEMDDIIAIARENNLLIIEDASQGVGVFYKEKHVGLFGEFGILSYYGNKTITTGEGGVVLTKEKDLKDKIYMLKNHGRINKGTFMHETLGWNFSFTEMQAAIGIAQMNKLPTIINKKLELYRNYSNKLESNKIEMKTVPSSTSSPVHWFSNVICEDAEKLQNFLKSFEIPSRRIFYPLNKQPCLQNHKNVILSSQHFHHSETAYKSILSLPSSILMDKDQFEFIVEKLNKY